MVVVFDLGGTLMEFRGMPAVWVDFYKQGFEHVNQTFHLSLTEAEIDQSVEMMKFYNPRIHYREKEISPVEIFQQATGHWTHQIDLEKIIACFFDGMNLEAVIYDDSFRLLEKYRSEGAFLACLTDLPSGMPDDIFKKPLGKLIDQFDFYVSSQSCGYRKPNRFGLDEIAGHFHVDVTELLLIGDEEKDRQTAKNAGCAFQWIGEMLK